MLHTHRGIGSRGGDACNLTCILHHGGDGAAGGAEGGSTGCQVAGMVGQVADGCGESVGGCIEHTRDGPCSIINGNQEDELGGGVDDDGCGI